jgi:hypothetical protein
VRVAIRIATAVLGDGGSVLWGMELLLAALARLSSQPLFALSLLAARVLRAAVLLPPGEYRSVPARADAACCAELLGQQVVLPDGAPGADRALCGPVGVLWAADGGATPRTRSLTLAARKERPLRG